LADATATFDFQAQCSRDSIRKPLVDDEEVRTLIAFSEQKYEVIKANKFGPEVHLTPADAKMLAWIESVRSDLLSSIRARYS
jgi:hypothetical protein